jgi:hypothetical protein
MVNTFIVSPVPDAVVRANGLQFYCLVLVKPSATSVLFNQFGNHFSPPNPDKPELNIED